RHPAPKPGRVGTRWGETHGNLLLVVSGRGERATPATMVASGRRVTKRGQLTQAGGLPQAGLHRSKRLIGEVRMKRIITGIGALLATAAPALAGGIERAPQSLAPLFEQGN